MGSQPVACVTSTSTRAPYERAAALTAAGVGHLAGARLHECVGHHPGVRADGVLQPVEGHMPDHQVAAGQERPDDRPEVALDAHDLRTRAARPSRPDRRSTTPATRWRPARRPRRAEQLRARGRARRSRCTRPCRWCRRRTCRRSRRSARRHVGRQLERRDAQVSAPRRTGGDVQPHATIFGASTETGPITRQRSVPFKSRAAFTRRAFVVRPRRRTSRPSHPASTPPSSCAQPPSPVGPRRGASSSDPGEHVVSGARQHWE